MLGLLEIDSGVRDRAGLGWRCSNRCTFCGTCQIQGTPMPDCSTRRCPVVAESAYTGHMLLSRVLHNLDSDTGTGSSTCGTASRGTVD